MKGCFFLLFLFFSPLSLHAADYSVDLLSIGQVRKAPITNQQQIPENGYVGGTAHFEKWNFSNQTNMRFFRDFDSKLDEYDLYQTVFHLEPAKALTLDLGRQFVNQGFMVEILDGIQATVIPEEHVAVTGFSGIPRSMEFGQFRKNDLLLTGLSVGLKNVARTKASVHGAWRSNNLHIMDLNSNDQVQVGGNFSHQFAVNMMPMFYSLAEYDTTGKVFNTATVGFDLYPSSRFSINGEGNYYNLSRDLDLQTVQATYSKGPTLNGRFAFTWKVVPQFLNLVPSYTFNRMGVTATNDFKNAHQVDAALQLLLEDVGLRVEPAYYYAKSFGGSLKGARLGLHKTFNDRLYADLTFDFTAYKKITNDNDNAYSTIFWTGYEVAKGLTLSGGMEYNKNNLFDKDIRGSFRLDYHLNRGS